MYETILVEKVGRTTIIKMNRPEKLNAWTHQMGTEMRSAISHANEDEDVSAIILTGEGRGFCAGADMEDTFKSRLDGPSSEGESETPGGADGWVELARASKPLIAAVNGPAIGVGITQILPFDVIVASKAAKFCLMFVRVGLVPELASSHFLVSRIGFGKASELMLSGRIISSEEALDLGLVDRLAEPEDLLPEALRVASSMTNNPVPMMKMIKELLSQNACETDLTKVQEREIELLNKCYDLPEHKEAVSAFLEKRDPDFKKARAVAMDQ